MSSLYLILIALYLAWGAWSGGFDPWLAPMAQRWRRRHFHSTAGADPMQAAADEHCAIMAPDAGLAIAVVTPSGVRQVFAGHIDGEHSPRPDADTPFEIGSLTKTFTAALLVALEREHRVQLDTTLDHLLPPDGRLGRQLPVPITLESLATHGSGLPRLPTGFAMMAGLVFTPHQPYRFASERRLWRWLRHRSVRYGNRYRYSNLGYGVLGQVLARIAGTGYAQALRNLVLEPLGLAATSGAPDARCAQPHTALGRRTPAWNLHALAPAGGVRSTLADMTRWLQANMAERAPLDARLHVARANSGGKERSIALAWHVDGEGERRVVWHNGRTAGSSSVMAFAPAHGIGIVVLGNSAASVDALGLRLLHAAVAAATSGALPERMQHIDTAA